MKKFRIDLHVHTNRYSPCAETLDPEKLGQAASDAGLDGLVITEHDAIWTEEEVRVLKQKIGHKVTIYRGVEVSSLDGHFIVIGLKDMTSIQVGISAVELFAITRKENAVVILAHPQRSGCWTKLFPENINWHKYVDAIEVASTCTFGQYEIEARRLATETGLSTVAGSDAHCLSRVGHTYTEFNFLPANELALAAAIRENVGIPKRTREKDVS